MSQQQHLGDGGDPKRWRTELPNLIDDLGLDPYQRALYVHYKRVCGANGGTCYESVRTTAAKTKMNGSKVSTTRRELNTLGLIVCHKVKGSDNIHIKIVDIWEINFAFYSRSNRPDIDGWTIAQVSAWTNGVRQENTSERSPEERGVRGESSQPRKRSRYEQKKEPIKKEPKKEPTQEEASPAQPPPHQQTFAALAQVCRWEPALLTGGQRGQLNQAEKKLRQHGVSPADILAFGQWWENHDWRGKRGDPPLPHQVRQEWGRFAHWRREHEATTGDLTAQVLANQAEVQGRQAAEEPTPDEDLAEAAELWEQIKRDLACRLDRGNVGRLRPTRVVDQDDGTIYVQAMCPLDAEWFNDSRVAGTIGRVAAEVAGRPVAMRFVAGEEDGPGSAVG